MNTELPRGWCRTSISDVAKVFLGKTPAKSQYTSGGVFKVVKFRDLRNGSINFGNSDNGFVVSNHKVLSTLRELRQGDVLITSAAHSGENIGKKCAYVTGLPLEFEGVFFTGELLNIRCDNDTSGRWVYFFFRSIEGFKELQAAVSGVHLTGGRAQFMSLPLAPRSEQRRVILKLEELVAKVEACQKRLAAVPSILKRFRQAVLAAACSGDLTADWRKTNIPDQTGRSYLVRKLAVKPPRIIETEDIPDTWEACSFDTIVRVQTGATPLRNNAAYYDGGTVPWVKTGEVKNREIISAEECITPLAIKETNAKVFPKGTILIAMYGEGKTRGQVGRLNIEAATNQACAALVNVSLPKETNEYLFLFCQSQYQKLRRESFGGNQPNLSLGIIKEWTLLLPPLSEQSEIVRRVQALFHLSDRLEARYAKAQSHVDKLSQSILARAFRGELVPTEAELAEAEGRAFESAEQLLARIQKTRGR